MNAVMIGSYVTGISALIGIGVVYGTMKTRIANNKSELDKKANQETVNAQFVTVDTKLDSLDGKINLIHELLKSRRR